MTEHPKPRSLDAWLRGNFTERRDTAQASNVVIERLLSTGVFREGRFLCPDSGRLCKGLELLDQLGADRTGYATTAALARPVAYREAPAWVQSVHRDLEESKGLWQVVRLEAEADIRRGLEATMAAETSLRQLEYVDGFLSQSLPATVWADPAIESVGASLMETADVHRRGIKGLAAAYSASGAVKELEHRELKRLVMTSGTTSASAVYIVTLIESQIAAMSMNSEAIHAPPFVGVLPDRFRVLKDLRERLSSIGPTYVALLDASEARLQEDGLDHLSQAAHSMRDLFEEILRLIAPSQAVKRQPWFEETPGTPDGVSRRSRVRYALYVSGEGYEREIIDQLDGVASAAKLSLDHIVARAHDHDPSITREAVEAAIDHARFALERVLSVRDERLMLPSD